MFQASVSPPASKAKQNFELRPEEFDQLLEAMKKGDDTLFEKVFLAQFEDCIKYLMARFKVNHSTAYDVSMEALLKFRKRLLEGKISYGNMRFLFTRMASQKLSDSFKKQTVLLDGAKEDVDKLDLDEDQLDALDRAWQLLCDECSKLLENYYYQQIDLKIIAERLKKTDSAIRKQKQRCLEKLRHSFLACYKR